MQNYKFEGEATFYRVSAANILTSRRLIMLQN